VVVSTINSGLVVVGLYRKIPLIAVNPIFPINIRVVITNPKLVNGIFTKTKHLVEFPVSSTKDYVFIGRST